MNNYQNKFKDLINNKSAFETFQMELSSFLTKNQIPIAEDLKSNHEEFLSNIESMYFFDKMQAIAMLANISTQTLNKIITDDDLNELKKLKNDKINMLLKTSLYNGNGAMFDFISKFKTLDEDIIYEAVSNYIIRFDEHNLKETIHKNPISINLTDKVSKLISKNKSIEQIINCVFSINLMLEKLSKDTPNKDISKFKENFFIEHFLNKKDLSHSVYLQLMKEIDDFFPITPHSQKRLLSEVSAHISYPGLSTLLSRELNNPQPMDINFIIDFSYEMFFDKIKSSSHLRSIDFLDNEKSEQEIFLLREKHFCSPHGFLLSDIYINIFNNLILNTQSKPIEPSSFSKLQDIYFVISENFSAQDIIDNYEIQKVFIKPEHIEYAMNNKQILQMHTLQNKINESTEHKHKRSSKI